jgi:hypothetical protein
MTNIILRRLNRFLEKFDTIILVNYFQISHDGMFLDFQVSRCSEFELLFVGKAIRTHKLLNFVELPIDLSRLIYSFLLDTIQVNFKMRLPNDYPFIAPIWSVSEIRNNFLQDNTEINSYYNNIIQRHNLRNRNWTPAHEIEKDILNIVEEIHPFGDIFQQNFSFTHDSCYYK